MIKKIYDANKTDFVEHHEKPDGINILDYKSSESAGVRSDIRSIIHLINLKLLQKCCWMALKYGLLNFL